MATPCRMVMLHHVADGSLITFSPCTSVTQAPLKSLGVNFTRNLKGLESKVTW